MSALKDLTGQEFGRLLVMRRANSDEAAPSKNKSSKWVCLCECGAQVVVSSGNLRSGNTKSCGCYKADKAQETHTVHGMAGTKIYMTWQNMKKRCYDESNKCYKDYGGRGIGVCDEWRDNFRSFYDWAIHNGYNDGLTIDRIDVNKGYSPENCKWATNAEQQNNKRNNIWITKDGKTQTLKQWTRELGLNYNVVHNRIRLGWDYEQALGWSTINNLP